MTNYIQLAIKYVKQNMRRSVITVIGTSITVMVLFACINLAYSSLLETRRDLREEQDYEIVLFTETKEQIETILTDNKIKSAYVGPYYYYNHGEYSALYENALYINTRNPYRINHTLTYLKQTYQVDGEDNSLLSWTYMQGSDGNVVRVLILLALMICYIVAIFGVSIVRNSIQLSILENVKDYGNLRCIGASKQQIKMVVFMQGLIIEAAGILLGAVWGTGMSVLISMYLKRACDYELQAGFHILPLIVVILAFVFDLYFIMDENAKLVIRMSPISALRGEYRIRTGKIKLHEKNLFLKLFRKVFGVEGDYACKNVLRNPQRFLRTILAFVVGIAVYMGIAPLASSYISMYKDTILRYKYYQIYVKNGWNDYETIDMVESSLPSYDELAQISELDYVTEAKPVYYTIGYLEKPEERYEHYSDAYKQTLSWESEQKLIETSKESDETGSKDWVTEYMKIVGCYGYDKEDLIRYQSVLTEGTVDLSSQGVILVNSRPACVEPDKRAWYQTEEDYDIIQVESFDYKVGDTIELLDSGELHRRIDSELRRLDEELWDALTAVVEDETYNDRNMEGFTPSGGISTPRQERCQELRTEYYEKRVTLIEECKADLFREGYTRKYVIEGIVNEDVNLYNWIYDGDDVRLIMSRDTYYDFTGTDASMPTGMMYHLKHLMFDKSTIMNILNDYRYQTPDSRTIYVDGDYYSYGLDYAVVSDFLYAISNDSERTNMILIGMAIVLFVLIMSSLNIINATASNLHLRKKEFSQLRVIGMSKSHLVKMVMLEGIITVVCADIIGILIGAFVSYEVFHAIQPIMYTEYYLKLTYHFPVGIALTFVVISVLVICGAIFVPLKGLSNDLAEDLKMSGE